MGAATRSVRPSRATRRGGLASVFLGTTLVAVAVVGYLGQGIASSASVTPTEWTVPSNDQKCSTLGYAQGLKLEPWPVANGAHADGDGTLVVTISNATAVSFDWSANQLVGAVIVKASTTSFVYDYGAGAMADTGLTGPPGHDISHVEFCYPPLSTTTTTTAPTTTTTGPSTTTTVVETTTTTVAETTTTTVGETTTTVVAETTTTIPGTTTSTGSPAVVTTASEHTSTTGGGTTLPRTGGSPQLLLLAGFVLLGVGARLIAAGRARRYGEL